MLSLFGEHASIIAVSGIAIVFFGSTGAVIWRGLTYYGDVLNNDSNNMLSALYVMPGEIQSIEVIPW